MYSKETIVKFIERIFPEPNTGCWLWGGGISGNGYGVIYVNKKHLKAHRVSVELYKNIQLSNDDVVCHKCNFRPCVNPDHLYVGTQAMNIDQAFREGRISKFMKHPKKIRQLTLDGKEVAIFNSVNEVTRKLGFNQSNLSNVCMGVKPTMYGFKWEYVE
jgi:hypothetical protein